METNVGFEGIPRAAKRRVRLMQLLYVRLVSHVVYTTTDLYLCTDQNQEIPDSTIENLEGPKRFLFTVQASDRSPAFVLSLADRIA